MSSNYGDKNLKIRIPIEIVPETRGIRDSIKKEKEQDLRSKLAAGREELRQTQGLWPKAAYGWDSYQTEDLYPRGQGVAMPGKGGPVDIEKNREREIIGKLVRGIAPTYPDYTKTKLAGTATTMPATGNVPLDERAFKKVLKNPDAGVHIYDPGPGKLQGLLEKALGGGGKAQQAMRTLRNPFGMVKMALQHPAMAPILVAIFAVEFGKWVTKELTRKGGLFDRTFRNFVDDRIQALRTRELQMQHFMGLEGEAQLITTTNVGTTNPRYSYNIYDEDTRQEALRENKFGIRNEGIS
jgi:hypothetical protein